MSADKVDVLCILKTATVVAESNGLPNTRDALIEVHDTISRLIKRAQSLTEAVRGFADGEMSDDLRSRLFLAASNERAKESFELMCDANDQTEAALSRIAQPGDSDEH